ncbi:MAG: hypothetical protein RMK63_12955 [Thermus sp.]|nr:hypothetical protein [Thermus sp.]
MSGKELSYDGQELVFEGQACLEAEGLYLEAPAIRYLEGEGVLLAENLTGEVAGWRVRAKALEGKELREVTLERGTLRAEAARVSLEAPTRAFQVLLTSPTYRARAEEALLTREEARLKGLLATPCPCGEDLRLGMEEARFAVATGELLGDARLGLWGLEVPLVQARANVYRRPELRSPLVLAGDGSGGWSVGLQEFPLPKAGEEVGRWARRLTLMATGLGTPQGGVRLGLREGDLGGEVRLGHAQGVGAFWGDFFLGLTPNPPDVDTPRLEARYAPRLSWEGWSLNPFLRYAETGRSQGLTLGLEAGYRWTWRQGPWSLDLTPAGLLSLYPFSPYAPYLALGGGLEAGYGSGDLSLRAGYAGRLEPLSPTPPFTWENRDEFQRLRLEAAWRGFGLSYTLENPLGQRLERLVGRYGEGAWGALSLELVRGSREEVRLAYAPPLPGRSCCQALWLSPELGWSEGGLSHLGLTLRWYDGCWAYEVRATQVLKGQYGENPGLALSFGLTLR